MAIAIYSKELDSVDSVFFPVVPDAFMKRAGNGPVSTAPAANDADAYRTLGAEADLPILTPNDRWSF